MRWPNKRPIIYCIDCGKELSRHAHLIGSIRCSKHAALERSKNRKGANSPRWKGGSKARERFCFDCGTRLNMAAYSEGNIRCSACNYRYYTGSKHHQFGRPVPFSSGIRYKDIYMRSSWEVAYAKYLDERNIRWFYEYRSFRLEIKNCETTYTPDFYLPDTDEYIEIKGHWFRDSKEKIEKFKSVYSDVKLTVLMKNNLIEMRIL